MSYLLRADVESKIPPTFVVEALDDNNDGTEDTGLWEAIQSIVDAEIDGALSQRYTLPLATVPSQLRAGASVLACEMLYQRRAIPAEQNPFTTAAGKFRSRLEAIASGKATLEATSTPTRAPISIITESAGTVPRSRLNG